MHESGFIRQPLSLLDPWERIICPGIIVETLGNGWDKITVIDDVTTDETPTGMRFLQVGINIVESVPETIGGLQQWFSADSDGPGESFVETDGAGNVSRWRERAWGDGFDLTQNNPANQPKLILGAAHPSGKATVTFDGNSQYLIGDGFLSNEMERAALLFVWTPRSLQDAVLWEHSGTGGKISIKLDANGAYGLAINGDLTEQAHSYKVGEPIMSAVLISPNTGSGIATAVLYHNTQSIPGASAQAGVINLSGGDTVTLGGALSGAHFHGEIREMIIYNSCIESADIELLADLFEHGYNLILNRTVDQIPVWWQYNFFNTLIDFDGDEDEDGLLNFDEFHLGTDPTLDETAQTSNRENFDYDESGRLKSFSPVMSPDEYDAEGNITTP